MFGGLLSESSAAALRDSALELWGSTDQPDIDIPVDGDQQMGYYMGACTIA